MIPFCDVCQIGSDIILVSFKEKEKEKPDKKAENIKIRIKSPINEEWPTGFHLPADL